MSGGATSNARISGYHYRNWRSDGKPPIMVNPKASFHNKIAWVWGEISMLKELLLDISCNDEENSSLASYVANRLVSVEAMLDHLGDVTSNFKEGEAA